MSKLKQRRLELNMTLEEVGTIVGVTKTTVRKWETGDIENMKRDKIQLLARALQVSPLFIMGIEETAADCCLAPHIDADFSLPVQDDSMINARIMKGDTVFVKKQEDVSDGEIAAVSIEGEVILKRVYKTADSITLLAENPGYKPMVYYGENCRKIRILGKAVSFQSRVR